MAKPCPKPLKLVVLLAQNCYCPSLRWDTLTHTLDNVTETNILQWDDLKIDYIIVSTDLKAPTGFPFLGHFLRWRSLSVPSGDVWTPPTRIQRQMRAACADLQVGFNRFPSRHIKTSLAVHRLKCFCMVLPTLAISISHMIHNSIQYTVCKTYSI